MKEVLLFLSILLLIGLLSLFFIFRALSRIRKNSVVEGRKEGSQVGFVVDTFHELVAKLKEKEKELEDLRKRAEERADVFESYNEYILQSVPSGVISLDGEFSVTKMNTAAEKILDVRADEVIGRGFGDVFDAPLRDVVKEKTPAERREIRYTTGSGKHVHIGYSLTPLKGARGEVIGQLLVFTDLTELKALESRAELRDRLSSLGEMAAGMAHELRNPMGVIAGYTKILSKRVDPEMLHTVDAVSREIAVMDRIITDFLSFARPTEPDLVTVDPLQIIRNCLSNLQESRPEVKIRLEGEYVPAIWGDEILLRQAFANLIQNAVEAMPHGGELNFRFSVDESLLQIAISDTGHGIPEAIRDKIFLPFYTTKDKGTGLGLAIVHKIIVSHRGDIAVESSDEGTTFRVRLPLKQ